MNERKVGYYKEYVISIVILLIILTGIIIEVNYKGTILNHPQLHIIFEMIGVVASFIMYYLLRNNFQQKYNNGSVLALGFLSISIFDLFHSSVDVGNNFVFFHTLASVFGSLFISIFVLINLFGKKIQIRRSHVITIVTIFICISIFAYVYPQHIPLMEENSRFTNLSIWLNIFAGIGYFIGTYYFVLLYKSKRDIIDYIFVNVMLLLTVSNLLFPFSGLWSLSWWGWHVLRVGSFISLLVIFFIVTEQYQRKISNQLEEIEIINKKLNDYSFTISHDLKEPIRSIRTFSEFILEDNEALFDATTKNYFDRIIKASTRMANMIDDLLILSRVGIKDVEFQSISLNKIIEIVLIDLDGLVKKTGTVIDTDFLPTLECQSVWMKVVFQNLIQNSIKYCDIEKEKIMIKLTHEEDTNFHYIYIKDNGIGIEEDQFLKIFQLFRRAYSKKDKEGSGAGLAIVDAIIQQHGGKIWVQESEIGKGTTMCFTILKNRGVK